MPTTPPSQDRSSAVPPKRNDSGSGSSMDGMEGLTAGRGFGGNAGGSRPGTAADGGGPTPRNEGGGGDGAGRHRGAFGAAARNEAAGGGQAERSASDGAVDSPTPGGSAAIVRRELIILVIALVCGFLLVPLAIWAVGNRILGPYTHLQDPTAGTGPMRLLADFYDGLAHGSTIFWCVGLGPYVLVWLIRLIYGLVRPAPASA